MKEYKLAVSVMSLPLGRLEESFKALADAGCDELHFNVADAGFAQHFTLGADFVRMAKECCDLPCHVHLMIDAPDRHISDFINAGSDAITIHPESCTHVHRAIGLIRDAGKKPGIAIKPSTSLTKLTYLLNDVDQVIVMGAEPLPGAAEFIDSAFERVNILKDNLDYEELNVSIHAECGMNAENAATYLQMGAKVLVLDSESLDGEGSIAEKLSQFRSSLSEASEAL